MTNNEIFLQTRLDRGYSQQKMADILGISWRAVADFEKGRTKKFVNATARKFEEIFGVKLDAAVGEKTETCPNNAYVNCPAYARKCKRCGWDESVKEARLAKVKREA